MRKITRTVYGAHLQSNLMLGLQHTLPEYGTMNRRFNIHADAALQPNDDPSIGYYTIGYGGHRISTGADMIPINEPIEHAATDVCCFKPLPFILRDVDDDLTIAKRQEYGLRTEITVNGQRKIAYYAKRIKKAGVQANMFLTDMEGGVQNHTPFIPTISNLEPTPLTPSEITNIITASGEYVSASAVINIEFDSFDAEELRNVARVLHGDERYAIVSEIAICSGVDRVVSGVSVGNNSINYNEIIGCQPVAFISTDAKSMANSDAGFTITTDVGITEPTFVSRNAPTINLVPQVGT